MVVVARPLGEFGEQSRRVGRRRIGELRQQRLQPVEMARRHGAEVVRLSKPWGEPFDPQEARDFIRREHPRVVAFVQAETSTGLYNQGQPICEAAHEVGALTIADCVTSLGGMPVLVDEIGIDIATSEEGLGKGFRDAVQAERQARKERHGHRAGGAFEPGWKAARTFQEARARQGRGG